VDRPLQHLQSETRLDAPDLRDGHELYAVLASALKSRAVLQPSSANALQAFWPATHFKLDQVAIFRDASAEEQTQILQGCNCEVLEEAYYIEKCGMYFAAKMSLFAESAQERTLYSLFAADEAVHFNWISRYVASQEVAEPLANPFIKLLDEILQSEDKLALTCMVQVVLEGWGISHYHALARDCRDVELKKIFENIIKDEARHHASGVILFNEQRPSAEQIHTLVEMLKRLLFMVQIGPQSVVSQLEDVKGRLSKAVKASVFAELDAERETARKLETLKALICSTAHADAMIDALDGSGAFRPYSAFECAEVSR
jgi:rubrerythrin